MSAVLGVDGGGRKTHAVVVDPSGQLLGVGMAGGSNWEIVGMEPAIAAIATATDRGLGGAGLGRGDVLAAVFGLAGTDWPADERQLDDELGTLGLSGERRAGERRVRRPSRGLPQPWGSWSYRGPAPSPPDAIPRATSTARWGSVGSSATSAASSTSRSWR